MNRTQRQIEDAASEWILRREAGLPPGEEKSLAAWCAADPRHADALRRHEDAWRALDRPRVAGHAGAMVRELARRSRHRRHRRALVATLAVAAIAAAGVWRWPGSRASRPASPTVALIMPELRQLADGSQVELRPGAEIVVDFSGVYRRVTLRRGEALFKVAKNKARPFIVAAGGVEVRAVGTAFDVQLDPVTTHVTVTEGRVRVNHRPDAIAPADHNASPPPDALQVFVDAGNRLTISATPSAAEAPISARSTAEKLTGEEIATQLAWRAPRLEFSGTPLGEAVRLMNRHSPIQMTIADPGLAAIRVSGIFRADHADAFVRILEADFDITAERAGDAIRLRPARR